MIRFLLNLFGKQYESEAVEILKTQLEYERQVNAQLIQTIASIANPALNAVQNQTNDLTKISIPVGKTWSRRRAAMEEHDRIEAQTKQSSKNLAKTDEEIKKLETELGLEDKEEKGVH